jgi:riboflavin biosynthesis pyrimidine reductase
MGRTSPSAAARPTIQQHLRAGLIDELHLAIVPILLGGGVVAVGEEQRSPPPSPPRLSRVGVGSGVPRWY